MDINVEQRLNTATSFYEDFLDTDNREYKTHFASDALRIYNKLYNENVIHMDKLLTVANNAFVMQEYLLEGGMTNNWLPVLADLGVPDKMILYAEEVLDTHPDKSFGLFLNVFENQGFQGRKTLRDYYPEMKSRVLELADNKVTDSIYFDESTISMLQSFRRICNILDVNEAVNEPNSPTKSPDDYVPS